MAYIINGTSFTNRKAITINNNSGSALTDYQVPITVTYVAAMKADYGDIRFAYPSGTYIPYWIEPRPAAEGGTVTISGGYRIHTFTGNGTFTANKAMNIEYLVVAGGGGGVGGVAEYWGMGGSGAGGFRTATGFAITAQAYSITVGVGGLEGASGGNSTFSSITSIGGGTQCASGGSGGGGSAWCGNGGSGTSGQGNAGGLGYQVNAGSGGGGAGQVGINAVHPSGGKGGDGLASNISGTYVYYAGGGGGGGVPYYGSTTIAVGGLGGGGSGGSGATQSTAGTPNTGGGGGGGGGIYGQPSYAGKSGGSGIVIIRYPLSEDYYIGGTASVWTKVNLSTGGNTVYMYYGNPSLTSASSTPNTFIREIPDVVGAWNLDGNALDTSGNGKNGTLNGGMGYTTGKFGQAGLFQGTDDYISIPDSDNWDFGSSDFTISWWEYRTASSDGMSAIARDTTTTYVPWLLGYQQGGTNVVYMSSSGSSWDIASAKSFGSQTLNTWNHFVITRSGSNFYMYKQNSQVNTFTSSAAFPASVNTLGIGKCQTGYYFIGVLDQIRIYSKTLTSAEIADIYNNYGYTTINYPGRELIRKYVATEPTVTATVEESPTDIIATSMTVSPPSESPCRTGICTVGVSVTWTNNGNVPETFVPSLTFSGGTITPTYSSEPLAASASVVHTFTISNMTAGSHSICPNPN